jgi:hypothetical protein
MIEVKDYSYKEFLQLSPVELTEYVSIMQFAKPFRQEVDIFNIGDITTCNFGLIKDLQYDLQSDIDYDKMFEHISMITKKNIEDLHNFSLLKILQFKNYYISEIKRICEIENNLLSYEPTNEEKNAGIENFNSLGIYNQIRNLAGNDVTKIEAVRAVKYSDCLLELYARKLTCDYEISYRNILNKKNKL